MKEDEFGVLSPIASDPQAVDPRLIEEAAKTAGMNPTTSEVVSPQWQVRKSFPAPAKQGAKYLLLPGTIPVKVTRG